MIDESCERGAAGVSVTHVVQRSGVSRRTFYETFDSREDCFAAAFEQALSIASDRVLGSYDPAAPWRERIRDGLVALLSFLDEEPRLGRLLIVESLAAGPGIAQWRGSAIAALTRLVEEGRPPSRMGEDLPPLTGEGIVGAVLTVLQNRLLDPAPEPLVTLASQLASMVVLPYLGAGAARRELERSTPVPVIDRVLREPLLSDPFKDVGMRLTYRTVLVLTAVSEHPGASNRALGELAGIADQGQISKLLNRLERVGMVTNTGVGPEKGGPNAWALTDKGARIVHNIRAHSESQDLADRSR